MGFAKCSHYLFVSRYSEMIPEAWHNSDKLCWIKQNEIIITAETDIRESVVFV